MRFDPHVFVANITPRWLARLRAWRRRRRDFKQWDREMDSEWRVTDGHVHPLDPERRRR